MFLRVFFISLAARANAKLEMKGKVQARSVPPGSLLYTLSLCCRPKFELELAIESIDSFNFYLKN